MKLEKLTLVLDPQTRDELREWARQPMANLLRRIVGKSLEQRRHQPEAAA